MSRRMAGRAGAWLAIIPLGTATAALGQQQQLTGPVGPLGSARTIAMGNAVVALGGDSGAVTVNPSAISGIGQDVANDITVGGGSRGLNLFAAHVYGQSKDQVPGAIWAAVLSGQGTRQEMIAYSASASDFHGIDGGATIRYEAWQRGGESGSSPNVDVGLRTSLRGGIAVGASILNIVHPTLFSDTPNSISTQTQIIGGIGYRRTDSVALEADVVYSKSRTYGRFGGEFRVTPGLQVRAGVSDKDFAVGAGFKAGHSDLSLAVVFPNSDRTVYAAGLTSHF